MKKWQAAGSTVMHSLCTVSVTVHCHALPVHSVTVHCHALPVHSQCYCALSCTACAHSVLLCTIMHSLCTVNVTVHCHAYYCALSCTACAQSVLLYTIMHNLCTISVTVHVLTDTRTSAASSSPEQVLTWKEENIISHCGQYLWNSHPVQVK
jgi:hypothetical protein